MRYSKKVFESAEKRPLSLKLALGLGMSEQGIISAAKRKSNTLLRVPGPDIIKKELNLTDEEIFEPQTSSVGA